VVPAMAARRNADLHTTGDPAGAMKVVLNASLGKAQLQKRFAEAIADQAVWADDADSAIAELKSADALVCQDSFFSERVAGGVRHDAPKMRWIQLTTAGYDHVKRHGVPERITVCNAGEAYAPAVATHALALLLAAQRRIATALSQEQRHAWDRGFTAQLT